MFEYFKRKRAVEVPEQLAAKVEPTKEDILRHAQRLAHIAIHFDEVVASLPADSPARLRIEESQQDLRRAKHAGEQFIATDRTLYN